MSDSPTVQAALAAFIRGYLPVPLKPGEKRPARARWTELSYEGPEDVTRAFEEVEAELGGVGVGLLLGEDSGGLIDIDLDHPKAQRMAKYVLPETAMISGRPSRPYTHYWYSIHPDEELPATRKFSLPGGETLLELRSTGGQTVIPPSLHPEQELYRWHGTPWGGEEGPARVKPDFLTARVITLAMAATLLDVWPDRGGRHDAYLALAGGLLRYGGIEGETGAIHPLWEKQLSGVIRMIAEESRDEDGADARISEVLDSTLRKLREGKRVQGFPTLGRLIGEAHTDLVYRYARDIEATLGFAARRSQTEAVDISLVPDSSSDGLGGPRPTGDSREGVKGQEGGAQGSETGDSDPLSDRNEGWSQVDLHEYLVNPNTGPQPGVLFRSDGVGLLYEGRVNSLYGSAQSGKTWIALEAMARLMGRGENVMLIDCEDGPAILVERLRLLGVPDALIRERFSYLNPDEPLGSLQVDRFGHAASNERGRRNEIELTAALDLMQPSLIVVDGITALYGMHSLNPNDAAGTDRITSWLRRLTNRQERTVVMIDHTAKNTPAGGTPTGSQHKLAMVQGAALHVTVPVKPREGHMGELVIYIGKDRPGKVAKHLPENAEKDLIAVVKVNSVTPGQVSLAVQPPEAGVAYPDLSGQRAAGKATKGPSQAQLDRERVAQALALSSEPLTKADLMEALMKARFGLTRDRMNETIKALLRKGRIENIAAPGSAGSYRLVVEGAEGPEEEQ